MDLDLGKHCTVKGCNQLDFLPFKCSKCKLGIEFVFFSWSIYLDNWGGDRDLDDVDWWSNLLSRFLTSRHSHDLLWAQGLFKSRLRWRKEGTCKLPPMHVFWLAWMFLSEMHAFTFLIMIVGSFLSCAWFLCRAWYLKSLIVLLNSSSLFTSIGLNIEYPAFLFALQACNYSAPQTGPENINKRSTQSHADSHGDAHSLQLPGLYRPRRLEQEENE